MVMFVKKTLVLLLILFLCTLILLNPVQAKPIDSSTLLANSFKFDQKTIEFVGEAIGEIMKRGNYAWVNVHDGQNAIGIFLKYEDAKKIKYLGRYLIKGDIIWVKGIFNRSCKVHGGDTDIHALEFKVIKSGYLLKENISKIKAIFAVVIFFLGSFLMWIVFRNKW